YLATSESQSSMMDANPWMIGGGALAVSGSAAAYVTLAPRCAFWGPIVFRGEVTGPPRVTLTFDDGPDDHATPAILDILQDLGVKATFFVVGRNVDRWPHLVRRID